MDFQQITANPPGAVSPKAGRYLTTQKRNAAPAIHDEPSRWPLVNGLARQAQSRVVGMVTKAAVCLIYRSNSGTHRLDKIAVRKRALNIK